MSVATVAGSREQPTPASVVKMTEGASSLVWSDKFLNEQVKLSTLGLKDLGTMGRRVQMLEQHSKIGFGLSACTVVAAATLAVGILCAIPFCPMAGVPFAVALVLMEFSGITLLGCGIFGGVNIMNKHEALEKRGTLSEAAQKWKAIFQKEDIVNILAKAIEAMENEITQRRESTFWPTVDEKSTSSQMIARYTEAVKELKCLQQMVSTPGQLESLRSNEFWAEVERCALGVPKDGVVVSKPITVVTVSTVEE